MKVASTAAKTPTKIEICAPLMALASTSRPQRSPPNGSVSARGGELTCISAARFFHSSYFGASGSMSLMSTGGPLGAARSIDCASRLGASPRKVGLAYGTPFSSCQPPATMPAVDSRISTMNAATTPRQRMPIRSAFSRVHAAAQTPCERSAGTAATCCAIAAI